MMSSRLWLIIDTALKVLCRNEAETIALANELAAHLHGGDVVALSGSLGAGKSVFSRAVMRTLGVIDEALPSPSFSIIQEYDAADCRVAHMDWYRLDDVEEIAMLGVRDYFQPPWICLIEWAERAEPLLSDAVIHVALACVDDDLEARSIEVHGIDFNRIEPSE